MGDLKLYLRKPIYNWGINDADYVTQPSKSMRCPYFDCWHSMIRRCYAKNSMKKNPSYEDKFVSEQWKYFTQFRTWMEQQKWQGNSLDKDILLQGNLEYGPENCIFVPNYVNGFFSSVSKKKAHFPLGVHIKTNLKISPYIAQGTENNKRIHLGCSSTELGAHALWQDWKLKTAYENQSKYREEACFDSRVDVKFNTVIENLIFQIENKTETTHIIY